MVTEKTNRGDGFAESKKQIDALLARVRNGKAGT